MLLTRPQGMLSPPGQGIANPMGQATAGGAPPTGAPPNGPQTALAVPGNVKSDAPPIGGMLGTPPPQMPPTAQSPQASAGSQIAQATSTGSRLQDLANFGLGIKQREELNKADVKNYTDNTNAIQQAGQQAQQGLPLIDMVRKAVQDPRYYSGFGSNVVLDFKKLQAAIGSDPNAAAAMEIFEKGRAGDILNQLKSKLQGLGQVRLAEINLIDRATANPSNTPQGNLAVLNIIERGYQQVDQMSRIADAYSGGARLNEKGDWVQGNDAPTNAGLNSTLKKFLEIHPTFSPEEIDQFSKTLGVEAKGGPPPKTSHPQPMATPPAGFNDSVPPPPPGFQ